MPDLDQGPPELVLATERLVLRPWRVSEAATQRELWTERDPRVPARRRIDAEGRPTVADFEEGLRAATPITTLGLLAVELRDAAEVIGYCGLVAGGPEVDGEPELAFELLRRTWGRGYATEASQAVLAWASGSGFERVWATVWDWNTPSRRVLAKLGFAETGRAEHVEGHGTSLVTVKHL